MPSLKAFRKMSGLPDSIRRWSDAAEQVKAGQKALVEQALVSKRSLERKPMDWHPQVRRMAAQADGWKPEDFQFEQWPVSNVRLENSTSRHYPFYYLCDITPGTPQDNQYVKDKSAPQGYRKLPDPVGMCLQSVQFRLKHAGMLSDLLDEKSSLPSEGEVRAKPGDRSELWSRLTPGTSINVELVAFPRFYFLAEDGGMQGHYANTGDGQFKGRVVESPVYTLAMDHDGNVSVT